MTRWVEIGKPHYIFDLPNDWKIRVSGADPFELYGLFAPGVFLPPRYLADGSAAVTDSFVLVRLWQMDLYQGDRKLAAGDTIWNRPDDPPLIAVYDPDAQYPYEAVFYYKLPDEEIAHLSAANLILIHWVPSHRPDQADEDNIVDRRVATHAELIDAGAGDDMIITGDRDDIVLAGAGDDHIDLGFNSIDSDRVEYQVMQKDDMYVAFDGGDTITGYDPTDDALVFLLHQTGTAQNEAPEAPAAFDFLSGIGTKLAVTPMFEHSPRGDDAPPSVLPEAQAVWADYHFKGLEFHFSDAVILPSGRLLGSVLTVEWGGSIRADMFMLSAGDDFDRESHTLTDRHLVEDILSLYHGDYTHPRFVSSLQAPRTRWSAEKVEVLEGHPVTKAFFDLGLETGETAVLVSGRLDNDLFRLTADGWLWWREVPDYEAPADANGDNRYYIEVTRTDDDGNTSRTRLVVVIGDRPNEKHVHYLLDGITGAQHFTLEPSDVPEDQRPQGLVAHLMGGRVYVMPAAGPLVLTWSLDTDHRISILLTQTEIDKARALMERAFAEFEAVINVKFVEVAHHDEDDRLPRDYSLTTGDFHVSFKYRSLTHPAGGEATFPDDDIGFIRFNVANNQRDSRDEEFTWSVDSVKYSTVVHEIGHKLGLDHPFESGYGWPGDEAFRLSTLTVMSYARDRPSSLTAADIEALQFLYGKPGTNWDSPERFSGAPKHHDGKVVFRVAEIEENSPPETDINWLFGSLSSFLPDTSTYSLDPARHDNALFTIDPATGIIRFRASPDYETPLDVSDDPQYDATNDYEVLIKQTGTRPLNLPLPPEHEYLVVVRVTDLDEPAPAPLDIA